MQEEVRIFSELSKESTFGRYELKFLLRNLMTQICFPKDIETNIDITSITVLFEVLEVLIGNFAKTRTDLIEFTEKNADVRFGIDISIFNSNSVRAAPYSKGSGRSYPLRPFLDGNKTHIRSCITRQA